MKDTALRSLVLAVLIAGFLGLLHALGIGLKLLLALGLVIAFVALVLPFLGVRWLDDATQFVRRLYWAPEEGHFHSFNGVPLDIEDDGRHQWVAAEGLQRVLGTQEPEPALAARHTGRWQRNEAGVLLLRVDAVVQVLSTMPRRNDPSVQRLRRYFEREVLFPARQRQARTGASAES